MKRIESMKRVELVVGCVIVACMMLITSAAVGESNESSPQTQSAKSARQKAVASNTDRGEQVFHQNCYRCHQEPQGFSPSISGTIARHMRVRANLSDEDYKALLKFLNP